jgi:hypothetical protein
MTVYMRDKTHTYLMLTRSEYSGRFLTFDSGTIEVVTLPWIDDKFWVDHDELVPFNYEFILAVEKYASSHLGKSPEAQAEITALLDGRPLVTPPEPVKRPPKAPTAVGAGYSLADLCRDAGIDPGEARKKLRQAKVEKPGGRWEWPSSEAAAPLLLILK